MGRRSQLRLGVCALTIFLVAQNTLGDETCRSGCQGSPQTFKYQVGKTYKYNYDSKIEIALSSAEGQVTNTQVKAQVLLTQQGDCNQVLRVQNLQIIGQNGKKYGHIVDVDKPIRLNFHDGHIEDSICVVPGDTQNSINIKRAIASLFQVNLKGGYETDVFGLCPTDTTSQKHGNILTVHKSRNLNKCSYRESILQDFVATAFNLNSEIKSSPILNGDYNSKVSIKNGILDNAHVIENYLFVPFSVGKNGAKAIVTTELKYTGVSADNPTVTCKQPRSIIFENPHPVNVPKGNVQTILNAVKETVKTIDVTVSEKTAQEFVNLVKILRVSNKDDVLSAYNQVKAGVGVGDKEAAKRLFLDALLRSGNGDAVEVGIELLKNKELSPAEEKLVYLGLSFVRHATENSLISATGLLRQTKLPREAYLGIGSLAGRYCREHSCKNVQAVNKLTQQLISKLGDNKAANREEENDMIYTLKALANIHFLNDQVLAKLTGIAQDKKAPNRLRAAALESYLADPCRDKLRDSALSILKDIQVDSELRIKAYLVLAQCPNAKIGNAIKAQLEKEPSYQVGGFIVSHIRNIRASANPDKQLAKQHLGFIHTPNKFPIDFRKWSFNSEFSYNIDTLGSANSIESNIIYSQNSFLPRSTSLNLTTEVFGHTFNHLEIQTRQENLDKLVEHYFGPRGLFRSKSAQELYKEYDKPIAKVYDHLQEKLDKTLRARRDVSKSEIESIGTQVQIKTNELNANLDLDLSVKVFGSELLFVNVNDDARKYTPEAIIDKLIDEFSKGLDNLKSFEETLRSNLVFLDAELAYPTSLGFPLRLAVEGTSNIQVKAKGNIDVREIMNKGASAIKLSLIPSSNIEVSGLLTLDAHVVENGLKVSSNLYTATGGDLSIGYNKDIRQGLDIKFGLPVDEQKLVSVKHEIVFHTRELGQRATTAPLKFAQNKDFSICLDQVSPYIGLTFCGKINGPNLSGENVPVLPFPLSGDAVAEVSIKKDDVKEYHFKDIFYNDANRLGSETTFDVIGKNGQKKVTLAYELSFAPEKYIRLQLVSPAKRAIAEGRLTLNDQEKSISAKVGYDNQEFSGKLGVSVSGPNDRRVYKPLIELKTPEGPQQVPYKVEGQIIVEQNGGDVKYIFDNVKVADKVSINGHIGREGPSYVTDLTLSDGSKSGTLKGLLQVNVNLIKANVELQNSLNPQANFNIKGEWKKQTDHVETHLQIIHGPDLSSKTNILTAAFSLTNKFETLDNYKLETKSKLTYPLVGISAKLEFEDTPKSLEYDVDFQYNDLKIGSELELKYNQKERGDYKLEFELYGLDNIIEVKSSRQIQGDESKVGHTLVLNGKKLEVSGKVRHDIKPQNIDIGADLTVKLPSSASPYKVVNSLKLNANEIDAAHKLSSGGTLLIDVFLKANKHGNANGNIKVNIKDVLVVNGQIKANKGSGSGEILIDAQRIKKQVKVDTTFNVQQPTIYNVVLNIYPVYNEDKNKKIVVSTKNKITEHNLDSSNSLEVFGQKAEVNLKGSATGDISNGKRNGDIEITLPAGQYLLLKGNIERKVRNDVINGNAQASVEYRGNKNTAGRKLTLKGTAKNTNLKEKIYDLDYNFAFDDARGKSLNGDLKIKRNPQGGRLNYEVTSKLGGSILENPLQSSIKGNCNQGEEGDFDISASYGPQSTLQITGKYSGKGPLSGNLDLDMKTPSKTLGKLKLGLSGLIKPIDKPTDSLTLELKSSIYADDVGTVPGALIDVKAELSVLANQNQGTVKGSVDYGKDQKVTGELGYGQEEKKDSQKVNGNLHLNYGQNKEIKGDVTLERLADHEYRLTAKLDTPAQEYKSNKIIVHTKRSDDGRRIQSNVELSSDGKQWNLDSEWVNSEVSPSIDMKLKNPEGKLAQIYGKINKLGDKLFGAEVKIVNQKQNFLLEGNIDANVGSVDDFLIKANIHSPTLNLEKVTAEAHNQPGKTGRRIQVTIKSGTKNLLSGSTTYDAREEHGKLTVKGNGSFKVKDETKSANFQLIRQQLTLSKNGENGIEISFDAGIGNKAIDAEFKLTNKQFRILNSYCEEKKDCAHIEIDSKTNVNDVYRYNQELEVAVDLRKLGLSHEFGLKAVTTRKEFDLDHTVDIHFQSQESSKYQYSLYIHPREAGVSLTTPKRQIALEGKVAYPQNVQDGGKVSGEVTLYLDKKHQPNKKTCLQGWANVRPKSSKLDGEVKFTHPSLKRPLLASIKSHEKLENTRGEDSLVIELDLFTSPNDKLVYTYKVTYDVNTKERTSNFKESIQMKSNLYNIDVQALSETEIDLEASSYKWLYKYLYQVGNSKYDNVISAEADKTKANYLIKVLNVDLLKISQKYSINNKEVIIDSEMTTFTNKPSIAHLELKNYNTLSAWVARKSAPNDKLILTAAFIPGQIADIRLETEEGSKKQPLFYATTKLDEANFLKSDHKVDSKLIEATLEHLKKSGNEDAKKLSELTEKWSNDIKKEVDNLNELDKRLSPNLKPINDYYSSELSKIRAEIGSDKTIKDLSELLRSIFGAVAQSMGEIFNKFSELVEKLTQAVQTSFASVNESINKELLPKLKEIADKFTEVIKNIVDDAVDVSLSLLAKVSQVIEELQPQLQEIATALGEISQETGRFIVKAYGNAAKIITESYKSLSNELKALPVFEELKQQYEVFLKEGLPNANFIINAVKEALATIKDVVPAQWRPIIDLIENYLTKKLKNEQTNDVAEVQKIVEESTKALQKDIDVLLSGETSDLKYGDVPLSTDFLSRLPKIVAAKFSPLSYVLKEDTSGFAKFLLTLVTKPRNWVAPFPLYGMVVQGQHIFTFDGKHLTFPGKCSYLLARDAVNGNFTLVGTYSNGLLNSITLADETDSVTIKKGGQVLLNNAAAELPARKPGVAAYRNYETIILRSTGGVVVDCTPDLTGCSVDISGFYHGQLRGILGNGNNEPYDDFTLPSGKIVESETEFGNAYKVKASCPTVEAPSHHEQPSNPTCDKLFSWESTLGLCYPFVSTENFKIACAHGLAAGVKDTEVSIAKAYVALCNEHGIPIRVPSEFVKCTNGDKAYDIGDTFSVKTPGKSADVVLLVDTRKSNEPVYKELVQPLVQDLNKEFHSKGINDVEFHLVTYGGENQWPSHVTVGGKLTFKGKAPALKFAEDPKEQELVTKNNRINAISRSVNELIHDIKLATGENLQAQSYREGFEYPFRANAAKVIIAVTGDSCEVGSLYYLQKLRTLLYRDTKINLNLITPFDEFKAKDSKQTKDVIGFNEQNVITLSQAKKKPEGSSDLIKELSYEDYCVDFTVKNRGNVFVTDNFLGAKGPQRKQFISSTAHNIVNQVTSIEQGLDCECRYSNPYEGRNVCREVHSKERAPATKKGVKG